MIKEREYFFFIFDMAETLLKNGAEINRVESTIQYVARAYNLEHFDSFIMINGIILTLQLDDETIQARVKEIPILPINLGRIEAINVLSRDIDQGKISFSDAQKKLASIQTTNYTRTRLKLMSFGFGSSTFSYLFSNSIPSALGALVIGLILGFYLLYIQPRFHFKITKIFSNLTSSMLVTILAYFLSQIFPNLGMSSLITGGIISLVPGVAMVNAIRYLFDGDYLSGAGMLMDAFITAATISVGVGIILRFTQWISTF